MKLAAALLGLAVVCACAAPSTIPPSATAEAQPTSPAVVAQATDTPVGRIRAAAVAGSWYPGTPDELGAMIDGLLGATEPVDGEPVGLIVPHAGYVYSGLVAAAGFRQLEQGEYQVAVIIASDHQHPLSDPISVWPGGGFETPLGVVPVDPVIVRGLVDADPLIKFDAAAHLDEHPIEIELPFLQRICPDCRLVPVLMGDDSQETVETLSEALLNVLPRKGAVVIASSDLSHYPSYEDARTVDGTTLSAIETGDPSQVRTATASLMSRGVPNLAICACGLAPILVTMRVAHGLQADTVSVLSYANSGDVPQGNRDRVVGYGAVMLWRYEPADLTEAQRETLLGLARSTLETYLEEQSVPDHDVVDPALNRRSGAFVTLRQQGELRGCIGRTTADLPLFEAVQQLSIEAATEDPRFSALSREELGDVTIEVSVLSPLRRLTDLGHVEIGTHGLMIFKDGRKGLLLPQVPVEQGWDRQTYLHNLCLKAGLSEGCWRDGAALYAFTAVVFAEE
jgi:AmmeMemoRadiSam system protein B/AmmeMemoRadiSam system protein A